MDDFINTISLAIMSKGTQAVNDCYDGLKKLIGQKLGNKNNVNDALTALEAKPKSKGRKVVLQEELEDSGISDDQDITTLLNELKNMLGDKSTGSTVVNQSSKGNGNIQIGIANGDVHVNEAAKKSH